MMASIVRIEGEGRCLGTGFVVGPRQVLTCAHLVDGGHRLKVIATGGSAVDVEETQHQWVYDPHSVGDDYALLTTAAALSLPPLTLLAGITPADLAQLSGHLTVSGYRSTSGDPGSASGLRTRGVQWLSTPDELLRSAQIEGGVPAGLSGAPVLVQDLEGELVAGMMCLGGEKAGVSMFLGADPLLAFLRARGVEPPTRAIELPPAVRDRRRRVSVLVSACSADAPAAQAARVTLEQAGFQTRAFADASSPAQVESLLAGVDTVLVLWSAAAASSDWPRGSELKQAHRLGNQLVFACLDDTRPTLPAGTATVIDLRAGPDRPAAVRALFQRLDECAGDGWDGSPYPGLWHFEETDAAVYFGRDREVEAALAGVDEICGRRQPAWFVILGASGVGKSSLLRAGLLPKLRSRPQRWLPLGPLQRGGTDPVERLAQELHAAFARHGADRPWGPLRDCLRGGSREAVRDLLGDLRNAAGQPDAIVLVLLDPVEDVLVDEPRDGAPSGGARLLQLLSFWTEEGGGCRVVTTLRSDFLAAFQSQRALGGQAARYLVLEPLDRTAIARIIEEPARVAGLGLEAGLTDQLVRDTDSAEALPLLAFKLRELYDAAGGQGWLRLADYRAGGAGLHDAIARRADAVLREQSQRLSELGAAQLRSALLSLVNVGEQGQVTRRRVRWSELPAGDVRSCRPGVEDDRPIHTAVQAFVAARLLVSMARDAEAPAEVEVAHEALFRVWPMLQQWIAQHGEFLSWRMRVASQVRRWCGEVPGAVSPLAGPELNEARLWLKREPLLVSDGERRYVLESSVVERRARLARRRLVVGGCLALAVLTLWALNERRHSTAQAARASMAAQRASDLAKLALARAHPDPTERIEILRDMEHAEAFGKAWLQTALDSLQAPVARVVLGGHGHELVDAAFSPDGTRVLTFGADKYAGLWDPETGQSVAGLGHADSVVGAAFAGARPVVLTHGRDGLVGLWNAQSGKFIRWLSFPGHADGIAAISPDASRVVGCAPGAGCAIRRADGSDQPAPLPADPPVPQMAALAFSPDGALIAATTEDDGGRIYLWRVAHPEAPIVLRGHTKGIENIAFSPDGRLVATSSYDRTAHIWHVDGKTPPVVLKHPDGVVYVAFSPDGTKVVTGCSDNLARVWRVDGDGAPLVLSGHELLVNFAEFSPDGRRIATASQDGTARIWNADGTGDPLVLRGHTGRVMTAHFASDGQRVVTASFDRTARVFDLEQDRWPRVLRAPGGEISAVAFSPDGQQLLTQASYRALRIWRARDGQPLETIRSGATVTSFFVNGRGRQVLVTFDDGTAALRPIDGSGQPLVLRGHRGVVTGGELSPDGRLIVTSSDDQTARIWNADGTGEPVVLAGHTNSVSYAVFSGHGNKVLTFSQDGTARVWTTRGVQEAVLEPGDALIEDAAISPDGRNVVTLSNGRVAWLWDLSAPGRAPTKRALEQRARVGSAQFSPDGRRLITAADDGRVTVWNVHSPAVPNALSGHRDAVRQATFSPDGRSIATASRDSTARIWEANGASRVLRHPDAVLGLDFSPDGQRLATACADGFVRVWDLKGDKLRELKAHDGRAWGVAFAADGQTIVSAGADGFVRAWDAEGPGTPRTMFGWRDNSVGFSPDGRRIVAASDDGLVRVWDVATGDHPLVLRGHEAAVNFAQFSPDGRRIVSASSDNTARIWSSAGGGDPVVLRGHTAPVVMARFSPDGRQVVTGSQDGQARIWNADGTGTPVVRDHGAWPISGVPVEKSLERVVHSVEFSPDSKRVLSAGMDGYTYVGNADGTNPLVALRSSSVVLTAAFDPDARKVVAGLMSSAAVVWDAGGGPPITLPAHAGALFSVRFDPTGKQVLTTGDDRVARLWSLDDPGSRLELSGHTAGVTTAAFSPDGRWVVTGSKDGTARVQSLEPEDVMSSLWAATWECLPPQRRTQLLGETQAAALAGYDRCRAEVGRRAARQR